MRSTSLSTLRPSAPPFIPLSNRGSNKDQQDNGETSNLLDMPSEVTAIILSKLIECKDSLSAALTCKVLLRELAEAPMSISFGRKGSALSSSQATSYIAQVSSSIAKFTPGLTSLDLSGLFIDNHHILEICTTLPRLRTLNLSGCKRITPPLCDSLCQSLSPAPPRLEALDLQRCFQLNGSCLSGMLAACANRRLHLQFLAMSHLDLFSLGQQAQADAAVAAAPTPDPAAHSQHVATPAPALAPAPVRDLTDCRSLRLLALNNCTRLTTSGLLSLVANCPTLSHLLLGGSTFAPQQLHLCLGDVAGRLEGMAAPMHARQILHGVRTAVESCPALLSSKGSRSALEQMACTAVALATAALVLPDLEVLEITFLPLPLVAAVSHAVGAVCATLGRKTPQVWDLTRESGVQAALQHLQSSRRAEAETETAATRAAWTQHLALAIKCAVNCSSVTRTTPLHSAAFGGNAAMAQQLLTLGSALDTRDVAGATAIFLAAEAGQAPAVRKLLDAGGDASLSNAAGESPLYIAALKGHLEVVRLLLDGFVQKRVAWHKLRYGDGWTPLMAAAVANHYNVAQCLLLSAGSEAALDLTTAANRYGQSALHIAARKGSPQLLQLLLCVGGVAMLAMADSSGETPMDVAVKHSHAAAVAEFRRAYALS